MAVRNSPNHTEATPLREANDRTDGVWSDVKRGFDSVPLLLQLLPLFLIALGVLTTRRRRRRKRERLAAALAASARAEPARPFHGPDNPALSPAENRVLRQARSHHLRAIRRK
jgi:hypothetical protein